MDPHLNSKKIQESESALFHTRLTARLCVALTCLVQFITRLATFSATLHVTGSYQKLLIYSLPLAPSMTIIVAIEYLLFKKIGTRIVQYSFVVDLILLTLFIADWTAGVIAFMVKPQQPHPPCFSVSALYGFISFAWRALLVTLIVQKWQLKIIAPVVAIIVVTGYAIHYDPGKAYFFIVRCLGQLFNVVIIIYCEDKIKWRMIWANVRQEKWMQVNNFILNNIPENIMILDVRGETKFISDYCKSFLQKCHLSLDPKEFFQKIRDLQQQQDELDPSSPHTVLQIERLTTGNELITDMNNENNNLNNNARIEVLTDLVTDFRNIMKEKNLQEKQFVIYNGKLKIENHSNKSIEVKISFVQHYKTEYIILILRDTTQRDMLVTLEKNNKYKDQLLASVSHELRAPLNGNINLVESAVNSPKISEEIKESLLIPALRSSKFLLHIINDILDISQIKENKLRLIYQSGHLKETLKSTAQLVEFQAQKKGISLEIELDTNIPNNFCTDHIRLSQIVLNLLSNAMKFTKEGTIKLTASFLPQTQWVKISVQDSGIGMSQENMNKLFANYTHIEFEGRQAMNPTGVGLGLNIASHLVQLLGPKAHPNISVVSFPKRGSIFSFTIENKEKPSSILPQNEELVIQGEEESSNHKIPDELPGTIQTALFSPVKTLESEHEEMIIEEACGCPKVLIVDDNPFNTMAFETILASLHMKCDSVYSGHCGIKKLLNREKKKCGKDCKQYSVIFMDQEMPEMTGAETVREIRRLQREKLLSQNMRIIGCTAHKSKEEVDRFLEAGLDKCIHKPISVCMIRDIL